MAIVGNINLSEYETRDRPLWWHTAGLSQTATGYGRKLATPTQVKYQGRWRRVYVCQFSNAGTAYIVKGKDWIVCN